MLQNESTFQCGRAKLEERGHKYYTGMIYYRQVVIHLCYILERDTNIIFNAILLV